MQGEWKMWPKGSRVKRSNSGGKEKKHQNDRYKAVCVIMPPYTNTHMHMHTLFICIKQLEIEVNQSYSDWLLLRRETGSQGTKVGRSLLIVLLFDFCIMYQREVLDIKRKRKEAGNTELKKRLNSFMMIIIFFLYTGIHMLSGG